MGPHEGGEQGGAGQHKYLMPELVEDSDAPQETTVSDRSAPEPEPTPAASPERYTDGVPVKPAWLGRTDLP
ncbi:hypothetical protein ABZ820_30490 [Streptomyces diacarni]|uniref:hypothetical protein n=1 Tax=Streptomyces diacarni TaxID=2800381 RepID=UPI0033CE0B3D